MTDADGTVVVLPDDTLPVVIARLGQAAERGGQVRLVVPIDSPLLLTASEFRALKDASDERRFPLLVRTADPLRLQLAGRTGLHAEALPRARPVTASPVVLPDQPPAPARYGPTGSGSDWPGPVLETVPEPSAAVVGEWPAPHGVATLETEDATDVGIDRLEPEQAVNPPRRWLPIAVALIMLVAAAYFGIRYLVPSAAVRIVPKTAAAAESIVFDVAEDGRVRDDSAAFAIIPQRRQLEVAWEGSAPVTGIRLEPDGTAAGPIELRNPSPDPAKVEAGTTVSTETGVAFAFTEDVAVPGADPASGRAGAASATVRAVEAGSGGNVDIGQLGGRLPNGVYYSNRMSPATGGTDREFPVVADADLEALSAAAKEAAAELVSAQLGNTEPAAKVLVTTVQVTDQKDEFSAAVGADAETVSLRSLLTIEFQTYDGAAAREKYEPLLVARLQDEVPDGYQIDPAAIQFEDPVEANGDPDLVRLRVAARADAVAVLDDEERHRLAAQLAGLGAERAAKILESTAEIESFQVDYQPGWLTKQMPTNADRIVFEVIG